MPTIYVVSKNKIKMKLFLLKIVILILFRSLYITLACLRKWYTLEPPHEGGSNEYPHSMFQSKNKKKCIPLFYYENHMQSFYRICLHKRTPMSFPKYTHGIKLGNIHFFRFVFHLDSNNRKAIDQTRKIISILRYMEEHEVKMLSQQCQLPYLMACKFISFIS